MANEFKSLGGYIVKDEKARNQIAALEQKETQDIQNVNQNIENLNGKLNENQNAVNQSIQNLSDAHTQDMETVNQNIQNLSDAHTQDMETVNQNIQNLSNTFESSINSMDIVIMVEAYGAKGDGSTDDTEAIQRCIDENPNSIILFKKGVYCISDEIHLYSNIGGANLYLGGAEIKWIGNTSPDKAMFRFSKNTGTIETIPAIYGGSFNGNGLVGTAISIERYHCQIHGCKIYDFTSVGILVDSYTTNNISSSQAVIEDVMIFHMVTPWSEGETIGIKLISWDTLVSNTNINRCKIGVYMKAHENNFVNCHFTTQFKEKPETLLETYAVQITSETTTRENVDTFINCYFDGAKYVFYAISVTKVQVKCFNSFYFTNDKEITGNDAEVFIVSGTNNLYHYIDNLTILPHKKYRVYDYFPKVKIDPFMVSRSHFTVARNNHHPDNSEAILANHLITNREKPLVFWTNSNKVTSGSLQIIGCLVSKYHATKSEQISPMEISISNRGYYFWKGLLSHNGTSWVIETLMERGTKAIPRLFIDMDPTNVTINGIEMISYNLYLAGDGKAYDGLTSIHVKPYMDGFIDVYINENKSQNEITDTSSLLALNPPYVEEENPESTESTT